MAATNVMNLAAGEKQGTASKLAGALGWMSIGLGVTQMVAPRIIASLAGVPRRKSESRLMGIRKIATGMGMLAQPQHALGLWTRVGTNLMELARLRKEARRRDARRVRVAATMAAVAGATVVSAICAKKLSAARSAGSPTNIQHSASTAVNRSPEDCYRQWRDFEKLTTIFRHLKSVRTTGDRRSEWVARGPDGRDITWSIEVTGDIPNQLIEWRSNGGSEMSHFGWVRFEPILRGKGTIVRVHMQYEIPASAAGGWLTSHLGNDPGLRLRKALLRFKQLLETGEIATTEGQSSGRPEGTTWLDRMARI
jgi:uncharacterized membrane protein